MHSSLSNIKRDAVVIHLHDACAVEFGINELEKQMNECDRYINTAAKPKHYSTPKDTSNSGYSLIIIGVLVGLVCPAVGWVIDDINIFSQSSTFTTIGWLLWLIISVGSVIHGISVKQKAQADYDHACAEYVSKVNQDKQRVQRETKERNDVIAYRAGLKKDYNKLCGIRNRLYSADIIPFDFRNLGAVVSLYNNMSTSSCSLEFAMTHVDLKIIQSQLSQIIEQNKEIILNQYIQQAQNERIIESNQSMLSKLTRIEKSAQRSEQYAKITASNSEVCKYMLTASYFRDLIGF